MAALDLGTAEGDGAAAAAALALRLSPLAIASEYDPWNTGSNVALAELGGGLAIHGEADGAAAGAEGAATQGFGAMQAMAPASSSGDGPLGGSLQLAGNAPSGANAAASLTGGGAPAPLQGQANTGTASITARIAAGNMLPAASADGIASASAVYLAIAPRLTAAVAGVAATQATLRLATALYAATAASSATRASMRVSSVFTGVSAGSAAPAATLSALAQLRGLAGNEGWEKPQIAGTSAGATRPTAALTITGVPSVSLSA